MKVVACTRLEKSTKVGLRVEAEVVDDRFGSRRLVRQCCAESATAAPCLNDQRKSCESLERAQLVDPATCDLLRAVVRHVNDCTVILICHAINLMPYAALFGCKTSTPM